MLDLHIQRRTNPCKRVGEGGDQRSIPHVAQRHIGNRRQQFAPLGAVKHRRLAGLDDMLRTAQLAAGLFGTTWPTTSQSNSMRTAASCCLTDGADTSICSSSI